MPNGGVGRKSECNQVKCLVGNLRDNLSIQSVNVRWKHGKKARGQGRGRLPAVYCPGRQGGDISQAPLQFPAGHFDHQGAVTSSNAERRRSSSIDENHVVDSQNSVAAILMHCHAPGRLHAYKKVIVGVPAKTMLCPFDRGGVALKKCDA